ncbi:hypothetical protein HK405_010877, partial [Cladochytrium tenue]
MDSQAVAVGSGEQRIELELHEDTALATTPKPAAAEGRYMQLVDCEAASGVESTLTTVSAANAPGAEDARLLTMAAPTPLAKQTPVGMNPLAVARLPALHPSRDPAAAAAAKAQLVSAYLGHGAAAAAAGPAVRTSSVAAVPPNGTTVTPPTAIVTNSPANTLAPTPNAATAEPAPLSASSTTSVSAASYLSADAASSASSSLPTLAGQSAASSSSSSSGSTNAAAFAASGGLASASPPSGCSSPEYALAPDTAASIMAALSLSSPPLPPQVVAAALAQHPHPIPLHQHHQQHQQHSHHFHSHSGGASGTVHQPAQLMQVYPFAPHPPPAHLPAISLPPGHALPVSTVPSSSHWYHLPLQQLPLVPAVPSSAFSSASSDAGTSVGAPVAAAAISAAGTTQKGDAAVAPAKKKKALGELFGRVVNAGDFEAEKHFYPRVLNAHIHPLVSSFFSLGNERILARYTHLNPQVNIDTLKSILSYQLRSDLFNVTTASGQRQMIIVETNSCPSGQKSMPLLSELGDDHGGYGVVIDSTFRELLAAADPRLGGLAVVHDKNGMEASGYAAVLAEATREPVWLVEFYDEDHDPPVRWVDGVMYIRDEAKDWHSIRACFRYVTQRPWNRFPINPRTVVLNS